MALIEWDRGLGPMLMERVAAVLTVTRQDIQGTARLTLADGRSVPVTAKVTLCRSPLSAWGDGSLECPEEIGFEALGSSDWLTLTFSGGAQMEIDVHDAKAHNARCRCLFEVKS